MVSTIARSLSLKFLRLIWKYFQRADDIITKILPEDKKAAKVELLPYFLDSFGQLTLFERCIIH